MLSDYDKASVAQILSGHGDWFTARLMRLIASADSLNREKLFQVFPEVVVCVSDFQGIPIQDSRRKFSNPSYGMNNNDDEHLRHFGLYYDLKGDS